MRDERALLLSHDMAQAIEQGARLLSTLVAIEKAHMLGDDDDLASILDAVDPVEVRLTAATLHQLSFLWHAMPPVRGGTTGAAQVESGMAAVTPLPLGVTAATSPEDGERPSAPIVPFDRYSRKTPCA